MKPPKKKAYTNKVEALIPFLERPGGDKPHAWGYGRVSTLDQDPGGSAQLVVAKQHFDMRYAARGFVWGGWFCDGASAAYSAFEDRDAAKAIIGIMRPGDVIIVGKNDRFYKSLLDYARTIEALRNIGVFLYSCDAGLDTSTDMGETISGISAVLAQQERRRMSTRRLEYLEALRLAGLCIPQTACKIGTDLVFAKMVGRTRAYRQVPNLPVQICMERCFYYCRLMDYTSMAISMHLNDYRVGRVMRARVPPKEGSQYENAYQLTRTAAFDYMAISNYYDLWEAMSESPLDVVQYLTIEERLKVYDSHKPANPFRVMPRGRRIIRGRTRAKYGELRSLYQPDYDTYQTQRALELREAAGVADPMELIEDIRRRAANPELSQSQETPEGE